MVTIGTARLKPEHLNGIYRDVAEHLGMDITQLVYEHYKGLQVTFPRRLLLRNYVVDRVCLEYDGTNSKALARKYGYSERVIRSMLKSE